MAGIDKQRFQMQPLSLFRKYGIISLRWAPPEGNDSMNAPAVCANPALCRGAHSITILWRRYNSSRVFRGPRDDVRSLKNAASRRST